MSNRILDLLAGDAQADKVVPPSGFTATLTLFSAAAMGFLAVFALALSLATARLADRWGSELARSSTLRISAPADQMAAQTEAALKVLNTTKGVASARAWIRRNSAPCWSRGSGRTCRSRPCPSRN